MQSERFSDVLKSEHTNAIGILAGVVKQFDLDPEVKFV